MCVDVIVHADCLYISCNIHVTIIMQEGLTALMEATMYGHKGTVKALVEGKADTNITDKVGWCLV